MNFKYFTPVLYGAEEIFSSFPIGISLKIDELEMQQVHLKSFKICDFKKLKKFFHKFRITLQMVFE